MKSIFARRFTGTKCNVCWQIWKKRRTTCPPGPTDKHGVASNGASIHESSNSRLFYIHRDRKDYQGRGAQDGRLDFHTAPELWGNWSSATQNIHKVRPITAAERSGDCWFSAQPGETGGMLTPGSAAGCSISYCLNKTAELTPSTGLRHPFSSHCHTIDKYRKTVS